MSEPQEKCIKCKQSWNPSLVESSVCIFCTNKHLQSQLTTLEAACAEKDGALKGYQKVVSKYLSEGGILNTPTFESFITAQQDGAKAISDSTSGQRILEENRRMAKQLQHVKHPQIHLDYYQWLETAKNADFWKDKCDFKTFHAIAMWVWSESRQEVAKEALSTNQLNQGK